MTEIYFRRFNLGKTYHIGLVFWLTDDESRAADDGIRASSLNTNCDHFPVDVTNFNFPNNLLSQFGFPLASSYTYGFVIFQ